MAKVYIILPVYNAKRHLEECIGSVIDQTFTDWNLISVDDGSRDGSSMLLDEHARKDDRIKVIHQENSGVSAARNAALDMIGGRKGYITFIDADDVYAPCWLEAAMKVVSSQYPDAILQEHVWGC